MVPVDTGNLQSSIGIRQEGENFVIVGPDPDQAPYCEFVEVGTSRMITQPYMGPTADQMESRFSIILAEGINKRIR